MDLVDSIGRHPRGGGFGISVVKTEDQELPWRVTFNFENGPIYGAGRKLSDAVMTIFHLAGFISDDVRARGDKKEAARIFFWGFSPGGPFWVEIISALENDW